MIDRILYLFPPATHALTLVSDPDRLLADEDVLAALAERGFTLVNEADPVALRYRVEQLRPFRADRSVIVVTGGPLDQLPYDLWQQGHHVTLALHAFFPALAYPVIRTLTPTQRWRLSRAPSSPHRLGQRATIEFVLRHVFDAEPAGLADPAALVTWLDAYHQRPDPLPALLAAHLLTHLQGFPAYAGWPLHELLASRDAFGAFVRGQWLGYLQQQGEPLGESGGLYRLDFDADDRLQDAVTRLVRTGTLPPVPVDDPGRLPRWAQPAVVAPDEDWRPRRVGELLAILGEALQEDLAEARWPQWQAVARTWAELLTLRAADGLPVPPPPGGWNRIEHQLDTAFDAWLRRRYAPLGSQRLPVPHHVHHLPHFIAYERRQGRAGRVALLILDGLALSDWMLIGTVWRARHADWQFQEHLVLAQVPTITAISRQALVSGRRPADFAATLDSNRSEAQEWAAFWAREGLASEVCPYVHTRLDRDDPPAALDSARTQALCLVDTTIDSLLHGAGLGTASLHASLRVWLDRPSSKVEEAIERLLAREFTVYLASDHGHVEAQGIGQPSEGLTVQTRGKRARLYRDERAALAVRAAFQPTALWSQDGLLPDDVWVLMPQERRAFAPFNDTVVTHGGLILDEVVVPFVKISGANSGQRSAISNGKADG